MKGLIRSPGARPHWPLTLCVCFSVSPFFDHHENPSKWTLLGNKYLIVEGQGSLLNPGSTATLPLMRGSCPTALVLCHRFGLKVVESETKILVPPLDEVINLNEQLVTSLNSFPKANVKAIALDTRILDDNSAKNEIYKLEEKLNLPVTDPVRFSAEKIANIISN